MQFLRRKCPVLFPTIENRQSKIENGLGLFAIVVAFTMCGARAEAQQPTKIPRIGLLSPFSPSDNALWHQAFRQGLRDLGWVEGKNISIEYRYAEGEADRLPDLAAELVRLKVDVIVAIRQYRRFGCQESYQNYPYRYGVCG